MVFLWYLTCTICAAKSSRFSAFVHGALLTPAKLL